MPILYCHFVVFPQVNKITFYLTAKTVSSVETSRLAKTGTSFLLNSSIFVVFQDSKIEYTE